MILVKKLKFFHILFLSKIDREKVFRAFWMKKKPLKTIKTTVYEKRKLRIFPNGLLHGFGQKLELLLTFLVMQNKPRKSIWRRSR